MFILMGVLATLSLTDTHYRNRMATLTEQQAMNDGPAITELAEIWKAAVKSVRHYPTGVGLGNFLRILGRYDKRYATCSRLEIFRYKRATCVALWFSRARRA